MDLLPPLLLLNLQGFFRVVVILFYIFIVNVLYVMGHIVLIREDRGAYV